MAYRQGSEGEVMVSAFLKLHGQTPPDPWIEGNRTYYWDAVEQNRTVDLPEHQLNAAELVINPGEGRWVVHPVNQTNSLNVHFSNANGSGSSVYNTDELLNAVVNIDSIVSVTFKGINQGEGAMQFIELLLERFPHIRRIDAKNLFPLKPRFVQVLQRCPQLHELHLSLLYHRGNDVAEAIHWLSADTECVLEHLEVYNCCNSQVKARHFLDLFRIGRISRIAIHDSLEEIKRPAAFGLAQFPFPTPTSKEYSTKPAYFVRRPPNGNVSLYTAYMVRKHPLLGRAPTIRLSPLELDLHGCQYNTNKHLESKWGYSNHVNAMREAIEGSFYQTRVRRN